MSVNDLCQALELRDRGAWLQLVLCLPLYWPQMEGGTRGEYIG